MENFYFQVNLINFNMLPTKLWITKTYSPTNCFVISTVTLKKKHHLQQCEDYITCFIIIFLISASNRVCRTAGSSANWQTKAEGSMHWMLSIKERWFINLYCQHLNFALLTTMVCSSFPVFKNQDHYRNLAVSFSCITIILSKNS